MSSYSSPLPPHGHVLVTGATIEAASSIHVDVDGTRFIFLALLALPCLVLCRLSLAMFVLILLLSSCSCCLFFFLVLPEK